MNRLYLMLAILFVIFQPVLVPTVHAVSSWSGNTWEGDSWKGRTWEGRTWDGSNLTWEGLNWTGENWTQNSWNGNPWSQDGSWTGQNWQGNTWSSNGWLGSGFDGATWSHNGWSGHGFTGNPYSGNGWSGQGFTGDSYSGNGWSGQGFTGNPYSGSGWSGQGFTGNPYSGNDWSSQGFTGDSYSGNSWSEQGFMGAPWLSPGYYGDPYAGTPWQNNGFVGEGTTVSVGSGATAFSGAPYNVPERFYDNENFKGASFLVNKMAKGTINQIDDMLNKPGYDHLDASLFITDLLVGNSKLHMDSHTLTDVYDLGRTGYDGFEKYREIEKLRDAKSRLDAVSQTAQHANQVSNASRLSQYGSIIKDSAKTLARNTDISNVAKTWGKMGALSKFNGVTSAVNAGVSAYKTGASLRDAIHIAKSDASTSEKWSAGAEVGVNIAETVMSVGAVASAIPGGQAVGAGLVVAGAGIYAISKGTQIIANNAGKIKAGAKKAWNKLFGKG